MNSDETLNQLECYTGWRPSRRSYNSSGPSSVACEVRPVSGCITLFSLTAALQAAKLFPFEDGQDPLDFAEGRWGRDVDQFFLDLASKSITREAIDQQANLLRKVMIGWENNGKLSSAFPLTICADLRLTVAVLARSVSRIYFPNRQPDYSWDTLFLQSYLVDEALPHSNL